MDLRTVTLPLTHLFSQNPRAHIDATISLAIASQRAVLCNERACNKDRNYGALQRTGRNESL